MSPALSKLVADGAAHARLAFGVDGTPVAAEELATTGATLFGDGADTDRVGLLMTNDRPTVEVFLGALVAGCEVVSLPPPGRGVDPAAYGSFITDVCATARISEVVVADEYGDLLEAAGLRVRRHADRSSRPLAAPSDAGFELVQFTSGSTGPPRGIRLDDARLGANITAILDRVRPQEREAVVSWLPLAHDMGLVGMLLAGIAAGAPAWSTEADIVLLDPATFLRRPASWLEAIDRWRGSFTAGPDFGFRMATQRPPAGAVDLSHLRCVIVGGEIVREATLAGFCEAYQPSGFDPTALCPSYGLAEVGLAAAITPPDEPWRARSLSASALADDQVRAPADGDTAMALVASGRALAGYDVRCDAESAGIGPIVVDGPSVGVDAATGASLAGERGYDTGDVGFVDDGWLYVCGRVDDYIVTRGRNVYAPVVEAAIGELDGVRPGRVTVVGLPDGSWAAVAEPAGAEVPGPQAAESLRRRIRQAAVRATASKPDRVVVVAPGSLPLTSSGKLRRSQVRSRLVNGDLSDSLT